MRRWVFESSLSIVFLALFAVTLVGQSFAGQRNFNEQQREHDGSPVGWLDYVTSADFGRAVMENWQSEFLQFFLFILATIWLVQRGSNESKELDQVGPESDERQRVGAHATEGSPSWARRRGWRLFRDGCPDGESVADAGARADRVVAGLRDADGNVLVFSSAHFLRVLAARWLGSPPQDGAHFVLDTASISILGYEHDLTEPVIRRWNQRS